MFIARQPILNQAQLTVGYELFCRQGTENFFEPTEDENRQSKASLSVLGTSMCLIGLQTLLADKPGFINFTPRLLAQGYAELVPPAKFTIELRAEDAIPEPDREACRKLRIRGYRFALDDVTSYEQVVPWLGIVEIVKIDLRRCERSVLSGLVEQLHAKKLKVLAEKLETHDEFRIAKDLEFDLFQGFYFSTPTMLETHKADSLRATKLLLLEESTREDFCLDRAEGIIKRDPTMTLNLLKYVNSSAMGVRHSVKSIRRALSMLGGNNLQKWVLMLIMTQFAKGKPSALLSLAVVRARFCELLAPAFDFEVEVNDLFLLGLFSLLAAIFSAPTGKVLENTHLSSYLHDALIGSNSPYSAVLQLVIAYENGAWESVDLLAEQHGIDKEILPGFYEEAIVWAGRFSA